jgi:hypothetical protein
MTLEKVLHTAKAHTTATHKVFPGQAKTVTFTVPALAK